MASRITAIMPCYIVSEELENLTRHAVNSLGKVELIVIDNASPQGGGYLRSIADVYIRNQENIGYARAVNQGLKMASNDLIAIANNDIIASPNWQEVAQEVLSDPNVYSCHFRMIDYGIPFKYGTKIATSGKERWCTSSFFVINKKRFLMYYDESYFNSIEDWDYWHAVRLAGFKTAYTDKACYQHRHSSTQIYIKKRDQNDLKNRQHFIDKWGDTPEALFAQQFPEQLKVPYQEGFDL